MIDITKQVAYRRDGASEDWAMAQDLVTRGKTRYGLFFAHLALEKALKAHVCRVTLQLAPKIHNLLRLAELARIKLSRDQSDLLTEMNRFNLEGRYPDANAPVPRIEEAQRQMQRANEVFQWLIQQL